MQDNNFTSNKVTFWLLRLYLKNPYASIIQWTFGIIFSRKIPFRIIQLSDKFILGTPKSKIPLEQAPKFYSIILPIILINGIIASNKLRLEKKLELFKINIPAIPYELLHPQLFLIRLSDMVNYSTKIF